MSVFANPPEPEDLGKTLAEAIESLLDGTITAEDHSRLAEYLAGDAAARRQFVEHERLHAAIHWDFDDLCDVAEEIPLHHCRQSSVLGAAWHGATGYLSNHDFVLPYSISAVLIGIAMWVSSMIYVSHHVQVARVEPAPVRSDSHREIVFVGRITGMVDVKWSDDPRYLPPLGFAHVPLGRKYKLDAGLMEITYDSGAKVILEGPCTYEVESTAGGYLSLGKLTARVETRDEGRGAREEKGSRFKVQGSSSKPEPSSFIPHPSSLFSVRTPTAVVTDLGTEFGVEVSDEGATESHVFRGSVRVQVVGGTGLASATPQNVVLRENESARVQPDKNAEDRLVIVRGVADPAAFASVRPGQLAQVAEERRLKPFRRWETFSKELRKRDDLAAYYDFQPDEKDRSMLRNQTATGQVYDGRIGNAAWVSGRFPGKYALRFGWPSIRIRVSTDVIDCRQLTLAAWVRIDSLPNDRTGLLMSDGWWMMGQVHWQILRDGKMAFSVVVGPRVDVTKVSSRPVVDVDHPGQWGLLAVACDLDAETVVFYCNGDCVGRQALEVAESAALNPGMVTIANWHNPNAPLTEKDFSLQGCVGELMIFRAALSEEEVRRVYQSADPLDTAVGVAVELPPQQESGKEGETNE